MSKNKNNKKKYKISDLVNFMIGYLKKFKGMTVSLMVLSIVTALLDIVNPFIVSQVVDNYFGNVLIFGLSLKMLLLLWCGIVALKIFFNRIKSYLSAILQTKVDQSIVKDLVDHVLEVPVSYHNNQKPGSVFSKISRASNAVTYIIDSFVHNFAPNIITMVLISVFMLFISIPIGILSIIMVISFLFLSTNFRMKKILHYRKKITKIDDRIFGRMGDYLGNISSVKSFTTEEYEKKTLRKRYAKMLTHVRSQMKYWTEVNVAQGIVSNIGFVGTIILGGLYLEQGTLTPGQFVLLVAFMPHIYRPMWWMANQLRFLKRLLVDLEEARKLLQVEKEVSNKDEKDIDVVEGKIEYKNVKFDYADGKVGIVKDVSFSVNKGDTLAIFGKTGSGKTTLSKLLLRLYDIESGKILVDDIDISKIKRKSIRSHIAVVPQYPILFNDTIMNNLKYGDLNASDTEVKKAVIAANALGFINDLPKGFQSKVGEKGVKLSGGQVQRIAIARALLRNPSILILDEATSSLDQETKFEVLDALERLIEGRTTIIITHDFSAITTKADKIIVLEDGKIAQSGKHTELIKQTGLYRSLYDTQQKHLKG